MKKTVLFIFLLFITTFINAQGVDCSNADPFCTGTNYEFPASVDVPNLGTVGCLGTTPNPAWYWMQIDQSGNIDIHMASYDNSGYGHDVDFILWGPFSSVSEACNSDLMSNSGVDCSYSTAAEEDCNIPNAQSGQVYILLITNYSNSVSDITFSQTGGTGTTDCGIVAPPVSGDIVCEGETIQLTVNNPSPGATYNWTGPNGFTSSTMNPAIPNATIGMSGTYSLTITVGTDTSPPVTCSVTVNPNPTITISPTNPTTCSGSPVTLTPDCTSPGTTVYDWSTGDHVINPITVTPTSTTTYSVIGTDQNGCTGTASVTVNIAPYLTITVDPPNPFICTGESVDLTATGADSYVWTPSATLSTDTGPTVNASPLTTTTYTVVGTSNDGCTGSTTVTVISSNGSSILIIASPENICPGDSSIITVYGSAQTYTWSPGISLSNTVGATTSAFPLTNTTYTVTADYNGCISTDEITIEVKPLPSVDFTSDIREGCQGLLIHFTDLTIPDAASWLWNFGDHLPYGSSSTQQNPMHYYSDAGTFDVSLSVVSIDGCKMKMTYPDYITIHPNPMAFFEAKPEVINELDSLVFFHDQSVNADIWNWYFGELYSMNNNSELQNPTHIYSDTGTYYPTLIVFTNYGCSDTITGKVVVEPNVVFYVPNAFTPNNDPKNQVFRAFGEGINLTTFDMIIYDRWGKLVFHSSDIEAGWDGNINGAKASEGVYVWHISYYDVLGKYYTAKGSVTLIK